MILSRKYLLLIHGLLGILFLIGSFSKFFSLALVGIALIHIYSSKNENNEALYYAAYMVGSEVLFRMSGGMIFYELPKYSVILLLGFGLIIEKVQHHISISYLFYLLLLLIGIVFVDIPFDETIRKAIAFNLSGPFLLGVSAIYCYERILSKEQMFDLLFILVLPILSMGVYLFFRTPSVKEIVFYSNSNFEASGGFGPNQVATILGLGAFLVACFIIFKKKFSGYILLDIGILMYLLFRGLITMSRGGLFTALVAFLSVMIIYLFVSKDRLDTFLKYFVGTFILGLLLFIYTSSVTQGQLTNRYSNKNTFGIEKQDLSTGRVDLFVEEFQGFIENPFFGLGVGGAKFYRAEKMNVMAASHNELSRLFAEHGMLAFFILFILFAVPILHVLKQPLKYWGLLGSFLIFWFLTINHSSMRIAFPGFIYGLSLLFLYEEETDLHRE